MIINTWQVDVSSKASKQIKRLPPKIKTYAFLLMMDLRRYGPIPGPKWKNYGKLKGQVTDLRHCHLARGKPTYVCCWEVIDKQIKLIEVYYVGTHEKAPY